MDAHARRHGAPRDHPQRHQQRSGAGTEPRQLTRRAGSAITSAASATSRRVAASATARRAARADGASECVDLLERWSEGAARRRTDRLLMLSEDLPLVSLGVETRPRVENLLDEVIAIKRDGLITLERARMLAGDSRETAPRNLYVHFDMLT